MHFTASSVSSSDYTTNLYAPYYMAIPVLPSASLCWAVYVMDGRACQALVMRDGLCCLRPSACGIRHLESFHVTGFKSWNKPQAMRVTCEHGSRVKWLNEVIWNLGSRKTVICGVISFCCPCLYISTPNCQFCFVPSLTRFLYLENHVTVPPTEGAS